MPTMSDLRAWLARHLIRIAHRLHHCDCRDKLSVYSQGRMIFRVEVDGDCWGKGIANVYHDPAPGCRMIWECDGEVVADECYEMLRDARSTDDE